MVDLNVLDQRLKQEIVLGFLNVQLMEVGPIGDLGQLLESALKNVGLDSSSIRELEPVQIQDPSIKVSTVQVNLMKTLKSPVIHTIVQLMEAGVVGRTVVAAVQLVVEVHKDKYEHVQIQNLNLVAIIVMETKQ